MKITEDDVGLRRAWTLQCYKEHENICWKCRIDISTPVIEIVEAKSFWGYWHHNLGSGTIKLSLNLINEHSWDVVINILKHEMAHQIVTELFDGKNDHGELFQRACQLIGVPDEFCGAHGDLPRIIEDLKEEEINSENRKILKKVKKLLSLAQSKNEHEASLAMQKVNDFIKKYNIERVELNKGSKYVYKIINHKKKRIENYQRNICSILMNYFFVEIVYSYLYEAQSNETYRTIEILGTIENVLMAEYVYFFLLNQLNFLWSDHQLKTGISNREKRSYWLGVLEGFREKLEQMEEKQHVLDINNNDSRQETTSALICAEDKMLSNFKSIRFPRLYKYRSKAASIYCETYKYGVNDGRHLTLHKGITQKDGFQGKFLSSRLVI